MQDDTGLVSIMMVNNEIGVKQPIKEIGQLIVVTQGNRTIIGELKEPNNETSLFSLTSSKNNLLMAW